MSNAAHNVRNNSYVGEDPFPPAPITPEQAMRPEVVKAVEDALNCTFGKLLDQVPDLTRHQIAVEVLRQIVCASVPPEKGMKK